MFSFTKYWCQKKNLYFRKKTSHKPKLFLANPVVVIKNQIESTNAKLTANNYSLKTKANRRWTNMFSLSPRHRGCSNPDFVNTNTSSTENSNNNLTASSTSSHETAIYNTAITHSETMCTGIGAISAALPAMMCGFSYINVLPRTHNTQAGELKNSLDDNAEQRISFANLGIEMIATFSRFPKLSLCVSRFQFELTLLAFHGKERICFSSFLSWRRCSAFLWQQSHQKNFYKRLLSQ